MPQDPVINVLATCSYALQRVIELMNAGPLLFSESEASEASECFHLHIKSYMWLAAYFWQRRKMYFKIRCKTHYNIHLADEIRAYRLNPTMFDNFAEEAFLGKIKRIAIRCHGATCTQRLFMRYFLCLAMVLQDFNKTAGLLEWRVWRSSVELKMEIGN